MGLTGGPLLTVPSHGRKSTGLFSSFIKSPVLSDQDFTFLVSFNLNHFLKGTMSNGVT